LHQIASRFEFDRTTLVEVIRHTLERRGTPDPDEDPIGLTAAHTVDPSRPTPVSAFVCRSGIDVSEKPAGACNRLLHALLSWLLRMLDVEFCDKGSGRPGYRGDEP